MAKAEAMGRKLFNEWIWTRSWPHGHDEQRRPGEIVQNP
jgi:hypothetical protein